MAVGSLQEADGAATLGPHRDGAATQPPSDLGELKQVIIDQPDAFAVGMQKVLRLVLMHPDLIAFGTVRAVADTCQVSPSTVVRVARHLGFRDFRALRNLFRNHVAKQAAKRRFSARTSHHALDQSGRTPPIEQVDAASQS